MRGDDLGDWRGSETWLRQSGVNGASYPSLLDLFA